MSKSDVTRANFMTPAQKQAMGNQERTHENCIAATGVGRPGKTAHERWKRANKA